MTNQIGLTMDQKGLKVDYKGAKKAFWTKNICFLGEFFLLGMEVIIFIIFYTYALWLVVSKMIYF